MSESSLSTLEITDSTAFAVDTFSTNVLFSNPESVLCLTILDPLISPNSNILFISPETERSNLVKPLSSEQLRQVLQRLPQLEELRWLASLPPPSELSELLSAYCPRLLKFVCEPQYLQLSTMRSSVPKWDASSLGSLGTLCITSLQVSRLSQAGSQELGSLLDTLGDSSSLEELVLDLVWFDDYLCSLIVKAGLKLRRLSIGTSGTKFTDNGLVAILEGCESLEHLTLNEVQGRLSRNVWTKPSSISIKSLEIVISETGPHHSWTNDHLSSIHTFPMHQLTSLVIRRRPCCPTLRMDQSLSYESSVDDIMALKRSPEEFIDSLKTASGLTNIGCDFWSFSLSDLKKIVANCTKLETIRLCLDDPFAKLLSASITSSFSNLRLLRLSFVPAQAPGCPPNLILPKISETSLPTPAESPVLPSKTFLPALSDGPLGLSIADSEDPSVPLLRDVKRFARKFPKLEIIEWFGRYARGLWTISRSTPSAKPSPSISVDFHPPTLDADIYKTILCEQRLELLKDHDMYLKGYCRESPVESKQSTLPSPALQVRTSPSSRHRKSSFPAPVQKTEELELKNVGPLTPPISEDSVSGSRSSGSTMPVLENATLRRKGRMSSEPVIPHTAQSRTRRRSSTNAGGKSPKNEAGSNHNGGFEDRGKPAIGHRKSVSGAPFGGNQILRGGRRASVSSGMTGGQGRTVERH